jgi:hypothetical protein
MAIKPREFEWGGELPRVHRETVFPIKNDVNDEDF